MAKTAAINIRIEPEIKKQAESIMKELGTNSSTVIDMLYRQIIRERRIPVGGQLPKQGGAVDADVMTEKELGQFLDNRVANTDWSKAMTLEEFNQWMNEKYGTRV